MYKNNVFIVNERAKNRKCVKSAVNSTNNTLTMFIPSRLEEKVLPKLQTLRTNNSESLTLLYNRNSLLAQLKEAATMEKRDS